MTTIMIRDEQYVLIGMESLYESEYENIIAARAEALFPGFRVIQFKQQVESEHGAAKADLALIATDLSAWYVVEVEMQRHSLQQHVVPQVRKLLAARYGMACLDAITSAWPEVDAGRVGKLLKGRQPRVVVVVDALRPEWEEALALIGALVIPVTPYRANSNELALLVGRRLPAREPNLLTRCRRSRALPSWLELDTPGTLDAKPGEALTLFLRGSETRWSCMETADRVWFQPHGPFPLPDAEEYKISRDVDTGQLIVEPSARAADA